MKVVREFKRNFDIWSFLAIFILVLFSVTIYPFIYTLFLSFHEWMIIKDPQTHFLGFKNYTDLLKDEYFLNSTKVTFTFVLGAVGLETLLGLALALLLNRQLKGSSLIRVALIMPVLLTPVAIGYLFIPILSADFGILNHLFNKVGLRINIDWPSNPSTALFSCVLIDVWQWTPFMFLILFTGVQSLPEQVYEAAKIDGASRWQTFRSITIPLMLPMLGIAVTLRVMDTFKIFDVIYVLTAGGPYNLTETLTLFIYRKGFAFWSFGKASASSILMLIFSMSFVAVLIKITHKRR